MKKTKKYINIMIKNAIPFLINLLFIAIFSSIFGQKNTLVSVAIGVGLTMLPLCHLKIKPMAMSGIIFILYTGSVIAGQSAILSPFLAMFINFFFVILIILLTSEPHIMKPSISFLLCFVFSQSTAVPWNQFPMRIACAVIGSIMVIITTLIFWKRKGYTKEGRTLKEQIHECNQNHRYMFRMAFGIILAMLIGSLFHIQKPLWISIVVMSLTQIELNATIERIKYRFVGNVLGVILFFLLFQCILPQEYAMVFIILLGYLGSFTENYKYKQAINAISALNASLVLLDTKTAIWDRLLFLLMGSLIVLSIYYIAEILKKAKIKYINPIKKQLFYPLFSKEMEES